MNIFKDPILIFTATLAVNNNKVFIAANLTKRVAAVWTTGQILLKLNLHFICLVLYIWFKIHGNTFFLFQSSSKFVDFS